MSADEYEREAKAWVANNGEIREDHPHTGANYNHGHWTDKGEPNVDFVCVKAEEYEKANGHDDSDECANVDCASDDDCDSDSDADADSDSDSDSDDDCDSDE